MTVDSSALLLSCCITGAIGSSGLLSTCSIVTINHTNDDASFYNTGT